MKATAKNGRKVVLLQGTVRAAHRTVRRPVKTVAVDVAIAPVVDWLNSFDGVMTRWSCQGYATGYKGFPPQGPYVIFYCDDPVDLAAVARAAYGYGSVEVQERGAVLRYCLGFETVADLDRFKKNAAWRKLFGR